MSFRLMSPKGLGRIGLKDVLQHVAVDGDAVTVHEVGRGGIAQQEQGQQRAKQTGQGGSGLAGRTSGSV